MMWVLCRTMASATSLTAACAVRFGRYPNDPGWKIGFEDWFQNELQRSLHDAVTDGGNRESPRLRRPLFWNFPLPVPHRPVSEGDQLVPYLRDEPVDARVLNGLERHAVTTRRTIVRLRHLVCDAQRVHFAHVHVE